MKKEKYRCNAIRKWSRMDMRTSDSSVGVSYLKTDGRTDACFVVKQVACDFCQKRSSQFGDSKRGKGKTYFVTRTAPLWVRARRPLRYAPGVPP